MTASAATDGLAAVAKLVSAADPNARVESLGGDLVDPEASQRILDACRTRLGAPRALVNNAALSRRGTLAEAGPADLADAARLVAWLCSDDAAWITGQILRSRGGL